MFLCGKLFLQPKYLLNSNFAAMPSTNYYQILQISPNSTADAIKKVYRKLALQYHPDITQGNAALTEKFAAIKEAYEVLMNPIKRKQFHEAFYFATYQQAVTTIEEIYEQAHQLQQFVNHSDVFRMDYVLVTTHLEKLLSTTNLEIIAHSKNITLRKKITDAILIIVGALNYEHLLTVELTITNNFKEIAIQFTALLKQKKRSMLWDKYAFIAALMAAIGFCMVMGLLV